MKTAQLSIRVLSALLCVGLSCLMAGAQEQQPQNPPGQNPQPQNPEPPPEVSPAEEKLPKYEDMEIPSVQQLLLESPVDWIRLKVSDEVIVCEPVYPRPDTLKKLQQQGEAQKLREVT